VPHSQSSLAFLTKVLDILSLTQYTQFAIKIVVFTYESQAKNTIVDIK
jgi:hypothetical protein